MSLPVNITVTRPHVPTGPEGVPPLVADSRYLRAAAANIRHAERARRSLWGSGVSAMVTRLLIDAADALDALACPECGDAVEPHEHSAPGFGGVEAARCPSCGWVAEP